MRTTSPNFSTKTKIISLFTTLSLVLISTFSKAQIQACGSDEHLHSQLLKDPNLKSRIDAYLTTQPKVQASPSANRTAAAAITIPVVVHVVYNTSSQNIPDAQIQSQIDVLNEDYGRTNADTVNTPSVFQPYAANPNIQFVLAKRDPNGNATNGITRTTTTVTAFTTNNYVKFDAYGGVNAWDASQYLNIWVCNLSGYAGYATTPGQTASIDGVVISYLSFGRIGTLASSSTKGRTTTHEIGHWLGLAHTWGWSGTCGDDGMADTPTQEKQNSGIPTFPHVSACSPNSNGDMFMNYMDYTDDLARNMFTSNQAAYMNGTLNGYRASLKTSLGGVAPGSTTTTVSCSVPSGLIATSITSVSAILNWGTTGATSYDIRYKATSSTTWNNMSSSTTSLSVSYLNSSTAYEFQVASVCSSTSSAYSTSSTFTTSAGTTTSGSASGPLSNTITIGASTSSQANTPYGTAFVKEHTQIIVTNSELVAAGYNGINNIINSLSFFVNTSSSKTLSNYTIKLMHVSNADFKTSSFIKTNNAVTVYSSNFVTSAGSWNKHIFTTPFTYNGTDNLLIDITWSNTSSSTSSSVYASTTTTNKTLFYGATSKKTNINNVTSGSLTLDRPNMLFDFSSTSAARLASLDNSETSISTPKVEMNIFPNPATENVNINLKGVTEGSNMTISVFDVTGSLIGQFGHLVDSSEKQIIGVDSMIPLTNLSNGIYIVTVEFGSERISQKFILNK